MSCGIFPLVCLLHGPKGQLPRSARRFNYTYKELCHLNLQISNCRCTMANYTPTTSGGYEYEFIVDVPDDYICIICQLVMRKPVQTKCGHRFCRSCLEEAIKRNPQCPIDSKPLNPQNVFEDLATERMVLSYKVKCPDKPCDWQGELREIEDHSERCDHKIVDCDNESCSVRKPRHEMVAHVQDECVYRMVACPHCKNAFAFCSLEDHVDECPQCPVSCPNKCGNTSITREQVISHTSNDCPLTIVQCSYHNIGCSVQVQRKQLSDHINSHDKEHLTIAVEKVLSLEKHIDTLTQNVNTLTRSMEAIQKQVDQIKQFTFSSISQIQEDMKEVQYSFTWKIKDFAKKLDSSKAKMFSRDVHIESDPFYIPKYGYKMKLRLYLNGVGKKDNALHVFLIIMRGDYYTELAEPFHWNIDFVILDQKLTSSQAENYESGPSGLYPLDENEKPRSDENTWCHLESIPHETVEEYIHDGALMVKIQFEMPQQVNEVTQKVMTKENENTYSLIWNIKHLRQERELLKHYNNWYLIKGPHTHMGGYKLKLLLFPDGDGDFKGTHMSVFLVVMLGEYDELLAWPFDWDIKFILVDQDPNVSYQIDL